MLAFYAAEKAAYDTMGKGSTSTTLDLVLIAVLSLLWFFQAGDKESNEDAKASAQNPGCSEDESAEK